MHKRTKNEVEQDLSTPLVVDSVPPDAKVVIGTNPTGGLFKHSPYLTKAVENKRNKPESWTSVIRHVTSMTPDEIVEEYGEMWRERLGKHGTKTMKELMVLRAVESFMDFPSASIFNVLVEREEGKVPQTAKGELNINIRDWRLLAEKMGVSEGEIIEELGPIARELLLGAGNPKPE